tara:strand:- start:43 stop:699 length:657 start_codon:yes stop_codon:yes gene_type:complete
MKKYANIYYYLATVILLFLIITGLIYRDTIIQTLLNYEIKDYKNLTIYIILVSVYFLTPLPITPIILLNGFLLKNNGFYLSYLLIFISSSALFVFSKLINEKFNFQKKIQLLSSNFKLIKYSKSNFFIFLSRYLIPYFFHNIFYGLINIKYTKFILIVLIAEIPLTFAINSVGISLKTYSQDQTITIYSLIMDKNFYIPIIIISVIFFIGKIIKKKLK